MTASGPGAAWKKDEVATGFIDDRRALIPLFDVQEDLTRRLITRGERRISRFCDLGAGDGDLAELVMEAHPASTSVLVDFSAPMLAAAQERMAARPGRSEIVEADLADPAWVEALPSRVQFDAIVSRLAIHHLPDERKHALYEEVFGLLDPGGLFLNWDHVAVGGLAEGMFDEYFVQLMLDAERERDNPRPPEEVVSAYDDAHDDDILLEPEVQVQWLRDIGFEQVEVYFKALELAIFAGVKPQEA